MVWGATLSLDRRVSSPSTSTIATLQASDKTLIETDVNTVVPAGNTYSGYDPDAYTIAQSNVAWATTPSEASGATTTAVTINLSSDNNYGEIACVVLADAVYTEATKPTGEQIYLGLDRNNAAAVSANKIDSATTDAASVTTPATSITLTGLTKGTSYEAFCTATNGVATFPSYIVYATDDSNVPVSFTTSGELEEPDNDDFALLASNNVVAVFLMIAALLFN